MPLIVTDRNVLDLAWQQARRQLESEDQTIPGWRSPDRSRYAAKPKEAADLFINPIPRTLWHAISQTGCGQALRKLREGRLPPHDQGRTNFCWAHGSTRTLELVELVETNVPTLLSAESVAVPITGGVNRGGTGDEAFPWLEEHGACRADLWPANDRSTGRYTPEVQNDALRHRVQIWLPVPTFDLQVTVLYLGRPLALGLPWWGHLVAAVSVEEYSANEFGFGFDNSWGPDWGDNGFGILDEKHSRANDGAWTPITTYWDPTAAGFEDTPQSLLTALNLQ